MPGTVSERSNRRDRWLLIAFLILGAVLIVRAARKDAGVLVRNQEFGARFLERADPYFDPARGESLHGPYPPSFALVAAPLSLLPTRAARVLWATAQVLALLLAAWLLRRRTKELWPALLPHAYLVFGGAVLLVSRYLLRDTAGGGGNLLYAVLVLLGLELAFSGRTWKAGLPIGLSLALKPNLAPVLLFFLFTRRFRGLAATGLTFLVAFALPAVYYGPSDYAELTWRWGERVVAYASLDDLHRSELVPEAMPPEREAMNQSLRAAVHRVARPPGDSGAPDVHVVETSPAVASWAARVLGLALAALCVHTILRARAARSKRAEWLAAMGLLPLSLLLSPIAWKAHHVALLPLLFGLLAVALERRRAGRNGLAILLVGYWVTCNLLSEELVGKAAKNALQAVSVVTWWNLVLIVVVALLVREEAETRITVPGRT